MVRIGALAALLAAFVMGPATAVAETLAPSVVAVVDFERILHDSMAGQALRQQVEDKRAAFQSEVAGEETKLRAEDQELQQQQAVLAPEVFAQKQKDFQDRVAAVQRLVQTRKQTLDHAFDTGIEEIKKMTIGILGELAKERGFNLVLPLKQVLLVETKHDLTEEVMDKVNQKLPTVTVTFGSE